MAGKSGSSHWRQRQGADPYVERALKENVRSRAYYKLEQIQARERILKHGMLCVDLGSTPGGWSQLAARIVGDKGQVVAVDLVDMAPVPGVKFIRGDFTTNATLAVVEEALGGSKLDLVMSDMAPNVTGIRSVDQPRAMALAELALDFSESTLRHGGGILVKLFQGEGFEEFVKLSRDRFQKVKVLKPKASRPESREMYLLARNYAM